MKKNESLPMHVQLFLPILEALRELGGSATPSELKDKLIESLDVSEEELEEKYKSGVSKIDNQISWSKIYLVRSGLLDTSNPDVLSLTDKGFSENPSVDEVHKIFKKIHGSFVSKKGKKETAPATDVVEIETAPSHKKELLEMLLALPPAGFERLCQRLLRASGFKRVVVKGRSGDGGIDGEGILEINPLVSMKVIFQSKRYKDAVSPSQIRDFRGALQGRDEKGIFITTGRFTKEAKAEAVRDGAPPIEIVDGDKLVHLFEKGGLGLRRKEIFEIDKDFFIEYM